MLTEYITGRKKKEFTGYKYILVTINILPLLHMQAISTIWFFWGTQKVYKDTNVGIQLALSRMGISI